MSDFSDALKRFIHKKDISVRQMADYCGLDRTAMYKVINGTRGSHDEVLLEKISHFMRLSPKEHDDLRTAYQITNIGRSLYFQRKSVKEFLLKANVQNEPSPKRKSVCCRLPEPQDPEPLRSALRTKELLCHDELNAAISQLLLRVSEKKSGSVIVLSQPDYPYLLDSLFSVLHTCPEVSVHHIICLDNSDRIDDDGYCENLRFLKLLLPLINCGSRYEIHYYYGNTRHRFDAYSIMPFFVAAGDAVVSFSSDYENGLLLVNKRLQCAYKKTFERLFNSSHRLSCPIEDIMLQWNLWENIYLKSRQMILAMSHSPCLFVLLDRSILDTYALANLPHRKELLERTEVYLNLMRDFFYSGKMQAFFTLDGLEHFMEEGQIEEIPREAYRTIVPKDRLTLLKRLRIQVEKGIQRLLYKDFSKLPRGIQVIVSMDYGYLNLAYGFLLVTVLEEQSLRYAFYDFIESLEESGCIASPQESLEAVDALIMRYEKTA